MTFLKIQIKRNKSKASKKQKKKKNLRKMMKKELKKLLKWLRKIQRGKIVKIKQKKSSFKLMIHLLR